VVANVSELLLLCDSFLAFVEFSHARFQFPLAQAISTGFIEDPLVQNILRVLKCRLLSDLKWKARISIPDGAYLMGK